MVIYIHITFRSASVTTSSEKRRWWRHLKACKHAITMNEGLIKLSPKSLFSHGQLYASCGEFYMTLRFGMWNTNKAWHFRYIPLHWMSPLQIVMWDVNRHDNTFSTSPFLVTSYTEREGVDVTGWYYNESTTARNVQCRKFLLTGLNWFTNIQLINSVAWVREWIIPTKRPPLVGEVSANFCG
jgi:hypothetical protein